MEIRQEALYQENNYMTAFRKNSEHILTKGSNMCKVLLLIRKFHIVILQPALCGLQNISLIQSGGDT